MEEKYFTVAEFAKKVGISRATLYRKIEKEFASFCIMRNGRKVISKSALKLFDVSGVTDGTERETVSHDKSDTNIITVLCAQLAEKDAQLAKISEQLKVKDEQINEKDLQLTMRILSRNLE